MKRVFPRRLVFAALIVCAFAQVQVFAKDEWIRVQSQNFSLIGNASDKEVRRVATKLEQFREVFKRLFPKLQFTSPVPTTVIVFKSEKSFNPYKPVNSSGKATKWIAGYFQGSEDANYIVLSTEGETQQTYTTIFHEYVHFLVNNSFGRSRIPPWFNEGIAEYYDQFGIEEDQKVYLGNLNENHLYSLANTKLIPFETFFNIDYYSLHQQGGHGANIFYAQSWAFVHYLFHGNEGARRGQLDVFLSGVLNGTAPKEAFQKAFQTDFATMEKELKKYVEQRSFKRMLVTMKDKLVFDNGMTSSPVGDPEAKATLGDLLFHSNRLAEAEAHLNESIAGDPNSVFASTSLGMVRMRQKRFPEAKALLEKALTAESKNHLVHYRYAYLLSRESMGENNMFSSFPDDATAKMRDSLKKAIALNPSFPETYSLLAFISVVRNDQVDESIGYISKALKLSPGNEDYILHLAALYSRKEEFDKAQAMAEAVFKSSQEQDTRARAQSILNNIASFRQYADAIKNGGRPAGSVGGSRVIVYDSEKPLTEEEIAKLKERAQLEGINKALRKPKSGEKRILGILAKIECGRSGIITYSIKTGAESIKLKSKDFQGLELMTFTPEFDGQIGCQGISKEMPAVLTFLPNDDPKTKTAGDLVAIEIVPGDFKFLEN